MTTSTRAKRGRARGQYEGNYEDEDKWGMKRRDQDAEEERDAGNINGIYLSCYEGLERIRGDLLTAIAQTATLKVWRPTGGFTQQRRHNH